MSMVIGTVCDAVFNLLLNFSSDETGALESDVTQKNASDIIAPHW